MFGHIRYFHGNNKTQIAKILTLNKYIYKIRNNNPKTIGCPE